MQQQTTLAGKRYANKKHFAYPFLASEYLNLIITHAEKILVSFCGLIALINARGFLSNVILKTHLPGLYLGCFCCNVVTVFLRMHTYVKLGPIKMREFKFGCYSSAS